MNSYRYCYCTVASINPEACKYCSNNNGSYSANIYIYSTADFEFVDTTKYDIVEKPEAKCNRLNDELIDLKESFNELMEHTDDCIEELKNLKELINLKTKELESLDK